MYSELNLFLTAAKKPTATARKSVATAQSGKSNAHHVVVQATDFADDAASAAASPSGTVRFLQTGHHMSEDLIRVSYEAVFTMLSLNIVHCLQQFEALGAKKVDDPLKCVRHVT